MLFPQFMQRRQEADIRKKLEDERQRAIDEAHWVVDDADQEVNGFVMLFQSTGMFAGICSGTAAIGAAE